MTQRLICIKAAKSHNLKRIYVNVMNLSNSIKLDVLKAVFCLKGKFLDHVACYSSFLSRREKWNWPVEMTCNGYMLLKHQRNCLVSPFKNLSRMDDYHLPLNNNFENQVTWLFYSSYNFLMKWDSSSFWTEFESMHQVNNNTKYNAWFFACYS